MPTLSLRRARWVAFLVATLAALAITSPASAAPPAKGYTCEAKGLTGELGASIGLPLEAIPLIGAGDMNEPCVDDATAPLNDILALLDPLGIEVGAIVGTTTNQPTRGVSEQEPVSRVDIADLDISLLGAADIIRVDAVESEASARCVAGNLQLDATSRVDGIEVFGNPIDPLDLTQPVVEISGGLASLPLVNIIVRLYPNDEVRTADSVTRRALRVEVVTVTTLDIPPLPPVPGPEIKLLELTVGETSVRAFGDPCDPATAPTLGVPDVVDREIGADVTAPEGTTITACEFTVTPDGGAAQTVPGVVVGDRCTAPLPAGDFPIGDYTATVSATTATGGTGTSAPGAFTLGGPTVGTPALESGQVVVPVGPGDGQTVDSCTITITPTGGGAAVPLTATFDPLSERCVADLPAGTDPGDYDVAVTVTDSNGDDATGSGTITVPAAPAGPTVGDPVIDGGDVVVPVTPGDGATVTTCEITVTPAGGGATVPVTDVRYDAATDSCVATLPADLDPGDYDVETKVTDSNGDDATGSGTITVPAAPAGPTVGDPEIEDGKVVVPVTPGDGATVTACTITITPKAGGDPIVLTATYDVDSGLCVADLPTDLAPGDYDVTTTVTDSDGNTADGAGTITVPDTSKPAITVGAPIAVERAVGATVTVPDGVTVASCAVSVTPRGGGAETTVDGVYDAGWCVAYLPADQFPDGEYDLVVRITDGDGREFTGSGPVTVASFVAPTAPPTTTPTTPTTPPTSVADAALQCESRQIVLTDVRRSNGRVRLAGATTRANAGKTVQIRFLATGKVAARAKVKADGSFSTTASQPARRYLRTSSRTKYRAQVDGKSSKALRLVRRMDVTSVRRTGSRIRIAGRATAPRMTVRQTVVLKRRIGCNAWRTVGRAKLTASGRFTITVADVAAGQVAAYRAETRVRSARGKTSAVRTYTLPRYVAAR
ncbi:MAG: hypothetical protein M0P31_05290 [Solirubrobacteraceae bacterium]|nr:hypothetical protein [Solirubrobacteraceae bacterium]